MQCDTMSRICVCGNNEIPGWCLGWECPALTGASWHQAVVTLSHSGPGGARHFTVTGHSTYGERCPAPDTGQAAAGENIQTRFCPAMMMRWWYDPHNVSSGYMTCHDTRCIAGHHTANLVALNTLHHPHLTLNSTPISCCYYKPNEAIIIRKPNIQNKSCITVHKHRTRVCRCRYLIMEIKDINILPISPLTFLTLPIWLPS